MRKSSDWMTIWDDRIMEVARQEGVISASELVDHQYIHTSRSTISRRLNKLADNGLLNRLPNGVYSLSEDGERYLDGELNAEDVSNKYKAKDENVET